MLIVTANWALTDGSLAPSGSGSVPILLNGIQRAVVRGGRGTDGRYRPVSATTLVLAGDTCDWLTSSVWAGRERPWRGGTRARRARLRVASETLRVARPLAVRLRRWLRRGVPVPAADRRGRPCVGPPQAVPLRIVLLAGDRDPWWSELSLEGPDGFQVGEAWSDGQREVRHGHELDPLAHPAGAWPRGVSRRPTLRESLAVDLIVPFASRCRTAGAAWPFVRSLIPRLTAAGPEVIPGIIHRFVERLGIDQGLSVARAIEAAWRSSVAAWHAAARREQPVCETEFDPIDDVASWLTERRPADGQASLWRALEPLGRRQSCSGMLWGHGLALGGQPIAIECRLDDGRRWREPLGVESAPPAVVTIGRQSCRPGVVDAA
jgi:hypothetical protein